jgi:dipeptidyl-peptidase 4
MTKRVQKMTNTTVETNTTNDISMLARYRRAEALENAKYGEPMVLNAHIVPQWIGDSDCFWYRRSIRENTGSASEIATEYRLVNAKTASNTQAFDHTALASALSEVVHQAVDAASLSISHLAFDLEQESVTFDALDQRWQFNGAIKAVDSNESHPRHWLVSPDGKKAVFIREHNLWMRELETGEECALTQDGEKYYAYAVQPESRNLIGDLYTSTPTLRPEAQWSPDSSKLFTLQTDERQLRSISSMLYVPQNGTVAPKVVERKYPLPGDKHVAQYRLLIIDVATAAETAVNYFPLADSFAWQCPFSGNTAWWSGDGRYTYFVDMTRGQKAVCLVRFDTQTEVSKVLFEETSETYLELGLDYEFPAMLMHLPKTNELIWPSERSGWWHLYRFDLNTGELKNAITSGDWVVRKILHLDKDKRELWIQLAGRVEGRNPYYREVARVNIDTGQMTVLASSDHDYRVYDLADIGGMPNNDFLVMVRSRVDEAPTTELRNRDGQLVLSVETADTSGLLEGWQWPEAMTMKADDGTTDIYGVIFRPSHFDPNKQYPVLDMGMASPMYSCLPTGAFLPGGGLELMPDPMSNNFYMGLSAIAELGFIVTVIEGRGSPYRSKTFNDYGYGSFADGCGLADHIAGIKQLAKRDTSMDLDRVGIITTDAPSNAAVLGLLDYPDFFKVGVSFSPAQPELIRQNEVYYGILNDDDRQPSIWHEKASQLEGKLLVITGLLDTYFHSSCTFQLADALVKANKDFDLQIHPNGGHALRVRNAHRRAWDYVVRHLIGVVPPKDFKLITGDEKYCPSVFSESSAS